MCSMALNGTSFHFKIIRFSINVMSCCRRKLSTLCTEETKRNENFHNLKPAKDVLNTKRRRNDGETSVIYPSNKLIKRVHCHGATAKFSMQKFFVSLSTNETCLFEKLSQNFASKLNIILRGYEIQNSSFHSQAILFHSRCAVAWRFWCDAICDSFEMEPKCMFTSMV